MKAVWPGRGCYGRSWKAHAESAFAFQDAVMRRWFLAVECRYYIVLVLWRIGLLSKQEIIQTPADGQQYPAGCMFEATVLVLSECL